MIKYDIRSNGKTVETYDKFPIAVKRKNFLKKENPENNYTVVVDYGKVGE